VNNKHDHSPARDAGFAGLGDYAAIGEGRSVALIAPDGAIDWWCAPNLDSPALFDRLLDSQLGGYFQLVPDAPWRMQRCYREASNVLETRYETDTGVVKVTESMNSTFAGRLPWNELARRVEGISGSVRMVIRLRIGTQAETRSPWRTDAHGHPLYHVADLMAMLLRTDDVVLDSQNDEGLDGYLTTSAGSRSVIALVAAAKEPLAVPPIEKVDERIDTSDCAWRNWVDGLSWDAGYADEVKRSALALKFLWYAPTGALAAAATTSLPEGLGKEKNYDYRYAWIRDACLIIKAFIFLGALEDSKAAFSWLSSTIMRHGVEHLRTCYTLEGGLVPEERFLPLEGYQGTQPVRVGNNASQQVQLSMYGDMLATARLFIEAGHVLDLNTSRLLGQLANCCADSWRERDSGIWELPDKRHYTHSKMACWLALDQAVVLAKCEHIEPTWMARWERERDRIRDWIETHCWSAERQAYTFYAGSDDLDAAITLTHRYGSQVNPERMRSTLAAIRHELGHDSAMVYRYSGVEKEESTFLACSFWLVEALAALDQQPQAKAHMQEILACLDQTGNVDIFNEMFDTRTRGWRGNMPQGLSHLALICAAKALGKGA